MANAPRAVTYNGYAITPVGGFNYQRDPRGQTTLSCGVLVTGADAAAFDTALTTAREKLSAADKDLTVTFDGETHFTYSASAATALRARCSITSERPIMNRASILMWSYTATLPAQEFRGDTAQGGFVDGTIALQLDQTYRHTYTFQGEYRSEPGGGGAMSARELKEDATVGIRKRIEDWIDANGIVTVPSGDKSDWYEITVDSDSGDWTGASSYEGAILSFQATARLSIIPTVAAHNALSTKYTVEQLSISGQRINWSAARNNPYRFAVSAVVFVDIRDDIYDTLDELYEDDLKPFLRNHVDIVVGNSIIGSISSGGSAEAGWIILEERKAYTTDKNHVQVEWSCQRYDGFGWLTLNSQTTYIDDKRKNYVKDADRRDDTYTIQSPGRRLRAIERYTGSYFARSKMSREDVERLLPLASGNWDLEQRVLPMVSPTRVVLFDGSSGFLHDVAIERSYTYVVASGGATFGDGGGSTSVAVGGNEEQEAAAAGGSEPGQGV